MKMQISRLEQEEGWSMSKQCKRYIQNQRTENKYLKGQISKITKLKKTKTW